MSTDVACKPSPSSGMDPGCSGTETLFQVSLKLKFVARESPSLLCNNHICSPTLYLMWQCWFMFAGCTQLNAQVPAKNSHSEAFDQERHRAGLFC